jgi:hypothetical protein
VVISWRKASLIKEGLYIDITEGLVRGKWAFSLKGDSKAEVSAERQKDGAPLDKIVHEQ